VKFAVKKSNIPVDRDLRILNCEQINICTILGFHTVGYEEFCRLGYNAVESVEKSTDISEKFFVSISITLNPEIGGEARNLHQEGT
jgi:hypothetical protein